MRSLGLVCLLAAAPAAADQTSQQETLSAFLAAADGREIKKVDRSIAECIVKHARNGQKRRLVKYAEADDQDAFVDLIKRASASRPKLESCMEGAALAAMMGG